METQVFGTRNLTAHALLSPIQTTKYAQVAGFTEMGKLALAGSHKCFCFQNQVTCLLDTLIQIN